MKSTRRYLIESELGAEKYSDDGLSKYVNDDIKRLSKEAAEGGHRIYIVGGAVRDYLLGKEPKDIDLATDAHPDQMEEYAREAGMDTVDIGSNKEFGIIAVKGNEDIYEVATFREDTEGASRKDADVSFTDISTDAKRRDLTMIYSTAR